MRIAVVGAGPAGLAFASRVDAEVFEEHREVGLPRHCTSLVGGRSAENVGVPRGVVLNKYDWLVATDLEGHNVYFRIRDGVYLLDRPGLERKLAERVSSLRLGERVEGINGRYLLTSAGVRGPYDVIVLAEGASRRFSKAYGDVVRLPGLQVDVRSDIGLEGIVVVYNKKLSNSYFSWIVELDRGIYRVGLADVCCTVERLRKLVKLIRGEPIGKPFGGGVLAGPPVRRLVHGHIALVGDAAGLTKPLSGGGIILALRSGAELGDALRRGRPSLYDEKMRGALLKLAAAHLVYRLMYGRGFVHEALRIFNKAEFLALDYDDHVKTLAIALLSTHRAPQAVVKALSTLLRSQDRRN